MLYLFEYIYIFTLKHILQLYPIYIFVVTIKQSVINDLLINVFQCYIFVCLFKHAVIS